MLSFNIAGAGGRINGITPGIKVAGQPFDTAALATGIPAFKADNQRNPAPIELKLEQADFFLAFFDLALIGFFTDNLIQHDAIQNFRLKRLITLSNQRFEFN